MTNILDAFNMACEIHEGQVDLGGDAYIFHLAWVMNHVDTEEEEIVAILHDALEDGHVSLNLEEPIMDALRAITRLPDESYMDYIRRCGANALARKVKIADLRHNMDLKRLPVINRPDIDRWLKYEKALKYLLDVEET